MMMQQLQIQSNTSPLFFILGPCVLEDEKVTHEIAQQLVQLSAQFSFTLIFKGSFDKANRGSLQGYRGMGMKKGLRLLANIRQQYNVPVITDVHESWQMNEVGDVVDVIQIPAFLARQTDLLLAAGKTGKHINIKKGQFMTAGQIYNAATKIKEGTGNENIWLCERGYTFGYENLVVDYRNFTWLKQGGLPVVFDATHAVQLPGAGVGGSSGGQRHFVANLAAAAVTQRIAGLFMEVHPEPEKAKCDGPNSVRLFDLPALLSYLVELDAFVKERPEVVTR
jgi:2-dehydro-3-deoxyphosphooctonate aldolase (KDO 8-P synthase)